MKIYLIRHGQTKGNAEKRYVGRTDEPLSEEGIRSLAETKKKLQGMLQDTVLDRIYTSPMVRCQQTAELLFPGTEIIPILDFREMDFGAFEYKNYQELNGNVAYQKWIDSQGTIPFPGGEEPELFKQRCVHAFEDAMHQATEQGLSAVAFVVHGGTIMSILSAFGRPKAEYYAWQVKNGQGYAGIWKEEEEEVCIDGYW